MGVIMTHPPQPGEIEGKKFIRVAEGSSRTIGNHSGLWSVTHWHSAPHRLALDVLWKEVSKTQRFGAGLMTENLPVLGKDRKRKAGLHSWNAQLHLVNTEERRKHFCGTKYSDWDSSQLTLHWGCTVTPLLPQLSLV